MPTLLTFDISTNGKWIVMEANDLPSLAPMLNIQIDYSSIDINLSDVCRLVLEFPESEGLNIVLSDNSKITLYYNIISRIGNITTFSNNTDVRNAFRTLIENV